MPDVSVSTTEPGVQNDTGPEAVTTGAGNGYKEILTALETAVQPPTLVITTESEPALLTVSV